jgi:hypothetical protein
LAAVELVLQALQESGRVEATSQTSQRQPSSFLSIKTALREIARSFIWKRQLRCKRREPDQARTMYRRWCAWWTPVIGWTRVTTTIAASSKRAHDQAGPEWRSKCSWQTSFKRVSIKTIA